MATPLRPNRPPRPMLKQERKCPTAANTKKTLEGRPKHLPVNVVFTVVGQVIVDDEGHLLDVDAASEEIGGDEDAAAARAELAHNDFALVLIHVSMLKHTLT